MRRTAIVFAFSALLCACSVNAATKPYDYPNEYQPTPYPADADIPLYSRICYYAAYILPARTMKSDGTTVVFSDVVVPYRYGEFSGHHVVFLTYSDPNNPVGKVDASPYEAARISHNGIDIEFVGHHGFPYVYTRPESSQSESDIMRYDYAAYIRSGFLEFNEALKLGYFTDDDLRGLQASANAIRDNSSLWHWDNSGEK